MESKNLLLVITVVFSALFISSSKEKTNLEEYTLEWEGRERTYYVHLPPEHKRTTKMPIVFNLHGGGGTAKKTPKMAFGAFERLADRDGFIVVYPQGVRKQWNDGRKGDISFAHKKNIDDVGFITQIVNVLNANYSIDNNKIFTVGMSNGGFMSTRLLCERPDIFRGGAILTAQIVDHLEGQCQPSQGVAVMVMNGTDDIIVPYYGGEIKPFKWSKPRGIAISTDDYVAMWQDRNDCKIKAETQQLPDNRDDGTTVEVTKYSDCKERGALELYTINGGGHTWPGGWQYLGERLVGKTSRDINACHIIWDFFKNLD